MHGRGQACLSHKISGSQLEGGGGLAVYKLRSSDAHPRAGALQVGGLAHEVHLLDIRGTQVGWCMLCVVIPRAIYRLALVLVVQLYVYCCCGWHRNAASFQTQCKPPSFMPLHSLLFVYVPHAFFPGGTGTSWSVGFSTGYDPDGHNGVPSSKGLHTRGGFPVMVLGGDSSY